MQYIITLTRSDLHDLESGGTLHCKIDGVDTLISLEKEYVPTCPMGYTDCVCDPAYIKLHHPEWYKSEYGDVSPEEASKLSCSDHCDEYDWEDK